MQPVFTSRQQHELHTCRGKTFGYGAAKAAGSTGDKGNGGFHVPTVLNTAQGVKSRRILLFTETFEATPAGFASCFAAFTLCGWPGLGRAFLRRPFVGRALL